MCIYFPSLQQVFSLDETPPAEERITGNSQKPKANSRRV